MPSRVLRQGRLRTTGGGGALSVIIPPGVYARGTHGESSVHYGPTSPQWRVVTVKIYI